MRIFLADLGHNQLTISSDVYPLGVANLASYVTAHFSSAAKPEVSVFREPEELKAALDRGSPDILGLSGYAWNHQLSLCLARYAKARDGGVLTLMGGPNYPLTVAEQEAFLRGLPEIDIAVRGPTIILHWTTLIAGTSLGAKRLSPWNHAALSLTWRKLC